MTKNAIRVFALALGLTAMFATTPMHAQTAVQSETLTIPFAFHVQNVAMPAGQYRLESVFGKDIVTLVNMQTGRRVQILRQEAARTQGKAKLTFEQGPNGYTLKRLS